MILAWEYIGEGDTNHQFQNREWWHHSNPAHSYIKGIITEYFNMLTSRKPSQMRESPWKTQLPKLTKEICILKNYIFIKETQYTGKLKILHTQKNSKNWWFHEFYQNLKEEIITVLHNLFQKIKGNTAYHFLWGQHYFDLKTT